MGLTKEDLLCHSRYIRDTLAPRIAKDGSLGDEKHFFDLAPLRSALNELTESPMTLDNLRFSRIEKALLKIVEASAGDWPPDIVIKAEELITHWEDSFGPLQRVRTDLWAPGGRLEGFKKPHGWFPWEGAINKVITLSISPAARAYLLRKSPETPAWSTEGKRSRAGTYKEGHCGFKVGSWWLNSAAACRDGIIDNLHYRITADNHVAHAIVMTQGQETNVLKDDRSLYTPYSNDPGAVKLMATIGGEQRRTVRVLRSWRLQSNLAPSAGLRYDGLYRVTGYSVKLIPGIEGEQDMWRYTFHLKREPDQESMEKVLAIPMPEQLDDWDDYKAGPTYSPEEDLIEQMDEGVEERKRRYTIGEDTEGRLGSIDSGYFSPHPSELKNECKRS
ncbi:MAG: hypothetical protein Q9209_001771 [Squamulea sp. 1 TL-2023]